MQCKICNNGIEYKYLGNHLYMIHKEDIKDYYDKHMKKENDGICLYCGKQTEFRTLTIGYRKTCNYYCSAMARSKEKSENLKKKWQNDEYKNKMSNKSKEMWSDEEFKKCMINKKIELAKNGVINMSKVSMVGWSKEGNKERASKRMAEKCEDPTYMKNHVQKYKTGFHTSKNGKNLFYQSSYELIAFLMFDKDENVLDYGRYNKSIRYEFDGINRHYLPDIFVEYKDCKKIIETKPKWYENKPKNLAKWKAAKEYFGNIGYEFLVWFEDDLGLTKNKNSVKNKLFELGFVDGN